MIPTFYRTSLAVLALCSLTGLHAQETDQQISGLQQAAGAFVEAHNSKDAAALAKLFSPNGEICGPTGEDLISGRDQIQAYYEDRFSTDDAPAIALEVDSVRLVTTNLAIEDGTVHLTPPGDDAIPFSTRYSAVLTRGDDGRWLIASSRVIRDVTAAQGQLADLAKALIGEWSSNRDSIRTELAMGWDSSGKFLVGDLLTQTADAPPQSGSMRIGWDGAKNSIVSWIFDSEGGAVQGTWTPSENGWIIRSEGTTSDGETFTANAELRIDEANTFVWSATHRIIDGELVPDNEARFVRRAPDPASN